MNMLRSECVKGLRLLKRSQLIIFFLVLALSCFVASIYISSIGKVFLILCSEILCFQCYYKLFLAPDDFSFYQTKVNFNKKIIRHIELGYYVKQGFVVAFSLFLCCLISGEMERQCFLAMSFMYLSFHNFRMFEHVTPFRGFFISVYYVLLATYVVYLTNLMTQLFAMCFFVAGESCSSFEYNA
ncbi:MAG: hypothetical protein ACRCV7_01030 [Culicoidibacterales bacterium]